MKILKPLLVVWFLACAAQPAAAAGTEESFQGALHRGAAPHPSQYSFADIYRLTVSGPALAGFALVPANDSPMRVAVTQTAPAPQFSIGAVPEPQLWLLLLSGVAAAAWVARRRLGYAL
jgi:hypothetical protein